MRLLKFLTRAASPSVNRYFKRAQVLNVIALAMSHGTNDGQKSLGLVAMALLAVGSQSTFGVPWWGIVLVALALMMGVGTGGWRIIRTLGAGIYKLRPVHAFAAQTAAAAIVLSAAMLGGPVSTTQTVSSAIMGVGSAERVNAVHWQVAGQMAAAWIITIPVSASIAIVLREFAVGWFDMFLHTALGM